MVYDKGQGTDTTGKSVGTIAHTRGDDHLDADH